MYSKSIGGKGLTKQINIRLTEEILKTVDRCVKTGLYKDRADFFRQAIREKLERVAPRLQGVPAQ